MVGPDDEVFNSRDGTSAILPGPATIRGSILLITSVRSQS